MGFGNVFARCVVNDTVKRTNRGDSVGKAVIKSALTTIGVTLLSIIGIPVVLLLLLLAFTS